MEYYNSTSIEDRAESFSAVDYDNEFLDLKRVKVGDAKAFYERQHMEQYGDN